MRERDDRPESSADRHLWQITPVRDLLWVGLAAVLLWLFIHLAAILVPILVALVLAYLVNPLITRVKERWGISRRLSIALIFLLITAVIAGALVWLVPIVRDQVLSLIERIPYYRQLLAERYGVRTEDLLNRLSGELGLSGETAGSVMGILGRVLGATGSVLLWFILVPVYFAAFAWHFQQIVETGGRYLGMERHPRAAEVLRRMDQAVGTFFRARLLICAILAVVFSVGWWLAGVPYWFLLGTATGLLNLIPYFSIPGWFLAVFAKYLDSLGSGGFDFMSVVVWPSVVFGFGNFLEGWVLTPWIHGRAAKLSPLVIITVVLVGGSLGGIWGMLLAIPVALCVDILAREFLFKKPVTGESKRA